MKKNNIQSKMSQQDIFTALMILIDQKDFCKISITELTKKAGVSRMAFYRNYNSKEDIIKTCFDDFFNDYLKYVLECRDCDTIKNISLYFDFFKKHQKLIHCLIKTNLSTLIIEPTNKFLVKITKEFICDKPDKYIVSFMTGGLYQLLLEWINNDMKESTYDMATTVYYLMFE